MIPYICHRTFSGQTLSGYRDIPTGYPVWERGGVIYDNNAPICRVHSENGARHFCRDDDGQGLRRGSLTFNIAYSDRRAEGGYPSRFSPDEAELLVKDYSHWLRPHRDVILFNDDFFKAPVEELLVLAEKLGLV